MSTTDLLHAALALSLTLAAGGCASGLSKDECRTADWQAIGYEDGLRGLPESRIADHRKACARHEVTMALAPYRRGRDQGLVRYCQAANGYRLGRAGQSYAGVCPPALEGAFLAAYEQGSTLHAAEADLRAIERRLRVHRTRLEAIETRMREVGLALVAEGTSVEQRLALLEEMQRLDDEHDAIEAEIPALEGERERRARQLASLRAGHQD